MNLPLSVLRSSGPPLSPCDPRTVGAELADYLRPVVASSRRVLLHRHGGEPQTFEVRWTPTGVARFVLGLFAGAQQMTEAYHRDWQAEVDQHDGIDTKGL